MSSKMEAITTLEGAMHAAERTINNFCDPNLDQDKQIPINLIRDAKGLAFLTVVKAGLIWTGRVGVGLVIARLPDGRWSAPSGIGTAGVGIGAEIGAQLTDFMIVLNSDSSVKTFMQKGQLSAGTNAEFAAGPYGRAIGASANIGKNGIAPNYTYSHSKGIFGGVGLQGSVIAARSDLNKKFYGRDIEPSEILSGGVEQPTAAKGLYEAIDRALLSADKTGRSLFNWTNKDAILPVASDIETEILQNKISIIITATNGPNLNEFKKKCKELGQEKTSIVEYLSYLRRNFTRDQLLLFLPDLIRLLKNDKKRSTLWEFYLKTRDESPKVGTKDSTESFF